MNASFPGGTISPVPGSLRICVVATPRLFADAIARTISLSGWPVDIVCSEPSELTQFERTLTDNHVAVIVDGAIPAVALGQEIRRRRPGQRVIVVGEGVAPVDAHFVQISSSTCVVELIRTIEKLSGVVPIDRQLTPRHVEILQLVAGGCTTDEVGIHLGIAAKTVNNHLSAVYRRLRTRNLTQAVLRAARAGLIDVSAT
jgi:DNA-binding CsgD family transcriptional regulator